MSPVFPEWFRIRSLFNGYVVAVDRELVNTDQLLRAQVYLYPAQYDEYELWQWDGQYLKNKATDLVLDIRKGRLRLIEDTEICLFTPKPVDKALNQRWTTRQSTDDLGRMQTGCFVCSLSNDEWVLEVQHTHAPENPKLLLFPAKDFDNESQRWEFEAADDVPEILGTSVSSSSLDQLDNAARDLSPSKRGSSSSIGSGSSVEAFKEAHTLIIWNINHMSVTKLSLQQVEAMASFDSKFINDSAMIQKVLQEIAEKEAALIYERCDQLNNNQQAAQSLAAMFVLKLHEQQPATP
ncbi:unnamed protein product [Umbelopsis vinacea]